MRSFTMGDCFPIRRSGDGGVDLLDLPIAIEARADVLEKEDALDKLEALASANRPANFLVPWHCDVRACVMDGAGRGGEPIPRNVP
jgi:hypothetical protein